MSDERLNDMAEWTGDSVLSQMKRVRKFYEAKIDSGELMAVNTVRGDVMDHIFDCAKMHVMGDTLKSVKFCPGCGAKIVSDGGVGD